MKKILFLLIIMGLKSPATSEDKTASLQLLHFLQDLK